MLLPLGRRKCGSQFLHTPVFLAKGQSLVMSILVQKYVLVSDRGKALPMPMGLRHQGHSRGTPSALHISLSPAGCSNKSDHTWTEEYHTKHPCSTSQVSHDALCQDLLPMQLPSQLLPLSLKAPYSQSHLYSRTSTLTLLSLLSSTIGSSAWEVWHLGSGYSVWPSFGCWLVSQDSLRGRAKYTASSHLCNKS